MITVALDTNIVAPKMLRGGKRMPDINFLDRMLFLQSKGKIKISFPKTTQAEVYAILRAGRMKFKSTSTGKKEHKKLPHHMIMKFVHRYKDLFDVKFMESLENVPGLEDTETYKKSLFNEIKYHLDMSIDQQKEYLENKGISLGGYKDQYDYYIMVSSIQDDADYLVTNNPNDFPNPLGNVQVITDKELGNVLPIYP